MKSAVWNLLYSRWRPAPRKREPGYTLLLPVPGDLPVFLRLAVDVCAAQETGCLVETLVIPDKLTAAFPAVFEQCRGRWPEGRLRLAAFDRRDRFVANRLRNPHANHWLQLVTGVNACRSTHALLHDADLFMSEREFLRSHYQACAERGLACLGVSPVWDGWYQERGLNHIVATWELMFDVEWMRSFKPSEHRGQPASFEGQRHEFDTMLLPQCHTSAARIDRHRREWGFVHFNYVICTYRWFQNSRGPYEDDRFRLLLVRLLIDAYDPGGTYEVPGLAQLERGLIDPASRVTYRTPAARENYEEFRGKLQQLFDSGVLEGGRRQRMEQAVGAFDGAMGWARPAPAPRLPPPLPVR